MPEPFCRNTIVLILNTVTGFSQDSYSQDSLVNPTTGTVLPDTCSEPQKMTQQAPAGPSRTKLTPENPGTTFYMKLSDFERTVPVWYFPCCCKVLGQKLTKINQNHQHTSLSLSLAVVVPDPGTSPLGIVFCLSLLFLLSKLYQPSFKALSTCLLTFVKSNCLPCKEFFYCSCHDQGEYQHNQTQTRSRSKGQMHTSI